LEIDKDDAKSIAAKRLRRVACLKPERTCSLSAVPPHPSQSRRDRLQAIVVRQARLMARLGHLPEDPLGQQVLAAYRKDPISNSEDPFAVRAWARKTAFGIAGDAIAHHHALRVASRSGSANRAGLSPEDVAQEICTRRLAVPPGQFKTVRQLQAWAGTAAINFIIDWVRKDRIARRYWEQFPGDFASSTQSEPPLEPLRLLADGRDFPRQATVVAAHLGERDSVLVQLFWLLTQSALTGSPDTTSKELARLLETTPGYVDKMRLVLRRRLRELKQTGTTEWDVPPDEPPSPSSNWESE
jgi:DNA-directed RNA polymerase specialized sigma24 family protein